jgi:hypothetical protein
MAIENHPVPEDGSPFPTLFWLTCPILLKRVSRLESRGRMTELNERTTADELLHARTEAAVARLIARRDQHAVIADAGAPPGGGADRIKCLHAHAAHELADPPNPVGAVTLAETGWPDCRTGCVIVQTP